MSALVSVMFYELRITEYGRRSFRLQFAHVLELAIAEVNGVMFRREFATGNVSIGLVQLLNELKAKLVVVEKYL